MRRLFATLALSAAVVAPGAVYAQNAPASQAVAQDAGQQVVIASPAPAPMVRSDVAGIQPTADHAAPLAVSAAATNGLHQGQGVALLAVGGAGLIAGLLIGGTAGTAVAIGGLAVGLVGLYQFIQ